MAEKPTYEELRERVEELEKLVLEGKRVEKVLQESEIRYRTFFEQSPDAVVVIDPETTLPTEFNDKAPGLLGYTPKEFAKLSISDYEVTESTEEVKKHTEEALSKGQDEFETLMRTKDGDIRDVFVSIRVIEIGGIKLFHNIFRDITEKKQAEEALRKEHKQLLSIFDSIDLPIYVSDPVSHEILFANLNIRSLFEKDLIGGICYKEFHILMHPVISVRTISSWKTGASLTSGNTTILLSKEITSLLTRSLNGRMDGTSDLRSQ